MPLERPTSEMTEKRVVAGHKVLLIMTMLASASAKAEISGQAPTLHLKDLAGNSVVLQPGSTGRATVLDFWATWCGPCRVLAPQLEKVAKEFEHRGVQVFNVDVRENAKLVKKYYTSRNKSPSNHVLLDPRGVASGNYEVRGIPTLVFIDTEGRISRVTSGAGRGMEAFLRQAFEEIALSEVELAQLSPEETIEDIEQSSSRKKILEVPPIDSRKVSPDGSKVVVVSNRGGPDDIWIMNSDGKNFKQITVGVGQIAGPAWSPDGSKIAFHSYVTGGGQEVQVVNVDGTGLQNLTNHPSEDKWPSWSTDGKKIRFTSSRDGSDWHLYIMDADGRNPTKLTKTVDDELDLDWK